MILKKIIQSKRSDNIQTRKIFYIAIITLQLFIPLYGFCDCSFCYSIAKIEIKTSQAKFTGFIKVNEGYGDCDCGAYIDFDSFHARNYNTAFDFDSSGTYLRMNKGGVLKLYPVLDSFSTSCPVWANGSWVKNYNNPPTVFLSGEIISINTNLIISYKIINYPVYTESGGVPYFSVSDYSKLKSNKIEAIFICDLSGSGTSMTHIIKFANPNMPAMDSQKHNEGLYSYKGELNNDAIKEISKKYGVIIFEDEWFD